MKTTSNTASWTISNTVTEAAASNAYSIDPTHATHTLVGPSFSLSSKDTITFTPRLGKDAEDLGMDYVKIFVSTYADSNQIVVWMSDMKKHWKLESGLRVWSADDAREIWNVLISQGWKVSL